MRFTPRETIETNLSIISLIATVMLVHVLDVIWEIEKVFPPTQTLFHFG